jgi:hypothetical protein
MTMKQSHATMRSWRHDNGTEPREMPNTEQIMLKWDWEWRCAILKGVAPFRDLHMEGQMSSVVVGFKQRKAPVVFSCKKKAVDK